MSNPTYNRAVRWIAYNDNDAELDQAAIEEYVTVALVADLFGKTAQKVAVDVFNVRLSRQLLTVYFTEKGRKEMNYPSQRVVTVCSRCLTEACLCGVAPCTERRQGDAGTVTDTEERIAGMTVSVVEEAAEKGGER